MTCDLGTLRSAATILVSRVILRSSRPPTGAIVNTATVRRKRDRSDPANDTATISTPTAPSVDLDTTKTATTTHYVPGGPPLVRDRRVANHGPSTATDARVTDPLPPTLTDAGVDVHCGTARRRPGSDSVDTASPLRPGARSVIVVTVIVAPDTTGVVVNVAFRRGRRFDAVAGAEVMPGRASAVTSSTTSAATAGFDPGEPEIAGVVVRLTRRGDRSVRVGTAIRAARAVTTSSPYVYANLAAGAYRVTVDTGTVPSGLVAATATSTAAPTRGPMSSSVRSVRHRGRLRIRR